MLLLSVLVISYRQVIAAFPGGGAYAVAGKHGAPLARPAHRGLPAHDRDEDRYHRLVVLIPEVRPARPWQRILFNQRGFVLDRAIQRGTVNVVICRLHFKLSAMAGER